LGTGWWTYWPTISNLEIVTAGSGGKRRKTNNKMQLVAIPLLKTVAATLGEKGDGEAL